jgi:hypothetical protein
MPKQKTNKAQKLQAAQAEHEAWLKSMGYKGGKSLKSKHGRRVGVYELPDLQDGLRKMPATSDKIAGNGNKKESQKYTGDYVTGIATTHKSNSVPITSREQAIQVSQMRRN